MSMMRMASVAAAAKFALILAAAMIVVLPAVAQDKPDYSGTWTLNAGKSDFGQVAGPTQETIEIKQSGSKVTENVNYTDDQGAHNYVLDLTLDGTELAFPADKGPQLGMVTLQKVKASWQGMSLVIVETLKYEQDGDVTGTNTMSLSPDGRTLTMDMSFNTAMGEIARKLIFDKGAGTASASSSMMSSASSTSSGSSASAASSSSSTSGPPPNLSGTWKLNVSKSDFGQIPPPDSRTEVITDSEPAIKIVATWAGGPMGDGNNTMDLDTSGKETTTQIMGNDAKSTAKWDGQSLIVNTSLSMQEADVTVKSSYSLSADGKTLTVLAHVTGPMGAMDMKSVYDKQ